MNGISFELVRFAFFWGVVGVDELVSSKFRDEHTVTKWGGFVIVRRKLQNLPDSGTVSGMGIAPLLLRPLRRGVR